MIIIAPSFYEIGVINLKNIMAHELLRICFLRILFTNKSKFIN